MGNGGVSSLTFFETRVEDLGYTADQREVLHMRFYAQDELSSIWQQLKDGTEPDEDLGSWSIRTDTETEQTLTLDTVRTYNDFDDDSTAKHWTRRRGNKEAVWGIWEPYSPA